MPVPAIGGGDRMGADAVRPHAASLTGLVAPTGHSVEEEDPERVGVTTTLLVLVAGLAVLDAERGRPDSTIQT